MVCNDITSDLRPRNSRKSLRRLASTRGFTITKMKPLEYGWIRVHDGPEPFATAAQSKLIRVDLNSTVEEVSRKLGMSDDLTLWMQIGKETSKRLVPGEYPLRIQEEFLISCGWSSQDRRTRLAVDPELRHALRFCIGPASRSPGVFKSGTLYLLKGHVFPQWKSKPARIMGSTLHLISDDGCAPEVLELCGGSIEMCPAKGHKLVLRVRPPCHYSYSANTNVFLGFNAIWERNLWFHWLKEASQSTQPPNVLDLSRGGKHSINVALQEYANSVFSIRVLILSGNNLTHLPLETFQLRHLTSLDLSDNNLKQLPNEIKNLLQLECLLIQRNELESLGGALKAPRLRTLSASKNLLLILTETTMSSDEEDLAVPIPLTNVDLRYNRLKGSITLGNYEHLVSLDVSHNAVEVLILSALRGLQELKAAHNALQHLSVHGASLRILHAPHNQLESLASTISPINLVEIDVSYNKLRTLPTWLSGCPDLTTLHASNNDLTSLPEHLFCSELSSLTSLHLAHNKITKIPSMPRLRAPLKELLLHDNCISALPENFFSACDRLFRLNLSNNRLDRLPPARGSASNCLEKLYLTANCLGDSVVDVITAFRSLRVLHISYNCLTSLPETCIDHWPDLEELSISGNSLMRFPEVLAQLSNLKILRAHSNRLRLVPMFSSNPTIKILDLSHNELETIDLRFLAPKQLKYLDISCNKKSQVDLSQFHTFRSQRPMRFVDVSGLNGVSHVQRNGYHNEVTGENPWIVGFSECPDKYLELWSSQLRLPSFCNREGLFGIIDGEGDNEIPRILQHILPGLLLEEKSIKETANEYMKYVVLSAHRELKDMGQKKGACLILCHISPIVIKENGFAQSPKKYMLRLANVGDTRAVLCRRSGPVTLGSENDRRLGYTAQYPYKIPDPDIFQTVLKEDDEFIILANKSFWRAIRVDTAVAEAKSEKDPIIAAKRLHDLAQSYGVEECISVIIIRFESVRSDVDMLMRELRQTIGTSRPVCRSDCCCSRAGSCCHSVSPIKPSSDRSSPSGQSDRPASEFNPQHYASVRSHNRASERRSCRGGVARAIRVRVEEEREEEKIKEEKPPSDEQFKCWEYMLEQNTQLLFDKELNTLTRGLKRDNGSSLRNLRGLSGSSPQLHMGTRPARTSLPFLSKHFGSTRSFGTNLKPDFRLGSGRVPKTGPNAAYFGSLQRLMPYHLEYDFAVIQEKTSQSQDSLDLEGRMQQYWGVATTEL